MASQHNGKGERSLDWIRALRQTRDEIVNMLRETEKAFSTHSTERATAALQLLDGISARCEEFTRHVVDDVRNGSSDAPTAMWGVRVAGHIGRLAREVADVTAVVLRKIQQRVLFSDKAVHEMKPLFALVQKGIEDLFDGIETSNQTLLIAVIATAERIASEANSAATEHEERLVRGLCQPKSSALFLDLIYSLRGISHTLKTLVKDVPEREN